MPITPLTPEFLPAVARFLARLNPHPAHNICYIGKTETEIAAELSVVLPPEGYALLALDEAGQVTGFLGVELDLSLGRAWLIGPFVEEPDWQALADQLYRAARQSLPQEINDLELCSRPENTRLEAFADRHGFNPSPDFSQLSLHRPAAKVSTTHTLINAKVLDSPDQIAPYLPALTVLHDALFPNTYYAANQLLAMSAEEHKCLQIALVDGELVGYIFLQARPANQDANIDFLGVAEPYRRCGIAGKLLADALAWAFAYPFVDQAILTVQTDNISAIRLYERIGFHTDFLMRGYRKKGFSSERQ